MVRHAWRLVPVHDSGEPFVLPNESEAITVGRRPSNVLVVRDVAVSGQHCVVRCGPGKDGKDLEVEVEDCSTNGTYVNERKLSKGEKTKLGDKDVISLTKPRNTEDLEEELGPRVQYRLEQFKEIEATKPPEETKPPEVMKPPLPKPPDVTKRQEVTSSEVAKPDAMANDAIVTDSRCMDDITKDLLIQEQQSKARITQTLLNTQRQLEEERIRSENAGKDAQRARQQAEDDRARRKAAEEQRDHLVAESKQLNQEIQRLKDVRSSHDALQAKQDNAEVEKTATTQRIAQLESMQDRMKADVDRANKERDQVEREKAELQTRLRQMQEKVDSLLQQVSDSRQEAERAQKECEQLHSDLSKERSSREALEDQVVLLKADIERGEAAEKAARDALETATSQRVGLESRLTACEHENEKARNSVKQMQLTLTAEVARVELVQESGRKFANFLRRQVDRWERSLPDGHFEEEFMTKSGAAGDATRTLGTRTQEDLPSRMQISTTSMVGDARDLDSRALQNGDEPTNDPANLRLAAIAAIDAEAPEATPALAAVAKPVAPGVVPAATVIAVAGAAPSSSSLGGQATPPWRQAAQQAHEVSSGAVISASLPTDTGPCGRAGQPVANNRDPRLNDTSAIWSLEMMDPSEVTGLDVAAAQVTQRNATLKRSPSGHDPRLESLPTGKRLKSSQKSSQ